ncbi:MAG: hypothetical protein AB8I08_30335 [Sandaracinaceae bacterium]
MDPVIPPDSGRMAPDTGPALDAGRPDTGPPPTMTDSGPPPMPDAGPMLTPGMCPDMDLGMMEGDMVASGVTNGLGNNVAPACATSNTDDATFTWTAPRDGDFIFDSNGSEYDTIIVILEGSDCSGTPVDCDDDGGDDLQSRAFVSVTEGTTYVIVVDGYSEAKGAYVLSINEGTENETDLCSDGIDNDRDGDVDCADSNCSSAEECMESGDVECSDGEDNDGDTRTDCDDSQCFSSAPCTETDDECSDDLDNDGDEDIDCDDFDCREAPACIEDGDECSDDLDNDGDEAIDCADTDCAENPACIEDGAECSDGDDNDEDGATDCADSDCARVAACDTCPDNDLASMVGEMVATGTVSEFDRREPAVVGSGECVFSVTGGRDQTFSWTAPSTGMFQIDTNGSSYDTVVYVLDGTCSGSELVCDDDGGDGLDSLLTLEATAGATYIIVLDTYSGSVMTGDFVLNITAM